MQLTKMELISKAQNNFNKLVSLLAEISYDHPDSNRWKIGATYPICFVKTSCEIPVTAKTPMVLFMRTSAFAISCNIQA